MNTAQFIQQIRTRIARDELPEALEQLRTFLGNTPKLDEILHQSGRFENIRRQIRLGVVSHAEANLTQNQIRAGLLELVSEIERMNVGRVSNPSDVELRAEIERAISIVNSKNAVAGSTISAGRDAHIGDKIETHHHYGDRKIPRALTENPFQPEIFIGREADLKIIHDKLFTPGGNLLLLVNGDGGVGKTSLASRYYHQFRHEYAHSAWVLSEKNIAGALLLLAVPLGLQFEPTMNTDQKLQILLAALADLDRPCLLVIDNANEVDDLQKHYLHLRRCSNFHLLLTSRITNFEKAEFYPINGLPEPEALDLFRRHYPKLQADEETLVRQIRTAVGGNTLVLELLAKNLAQFNRLKTRYALPDLLADLQTKGLLALAQSQAVTTEYQARGGALRHEKPEDIIAAMYDLGALPPASVALLSVFAVLPAERIGFGTLESLLPGLADIDAQLLALAQSGWIEYNDREANFKCSPVVQQITKEKNRPRLLEDCRGLIDALTEGLDNEVMHEDNYQRATQYARYAETLLLSLNQNDDDLATLCQNIGIFHSETGDLSKAMQAYQSMADIQSALLLENPDNADFKNGLAISYSKLGQTQAALGNLDKALTFYEDETQLFEELYEAYPNNVSFKNGLAISFYKLGAFSLDQSKNKGKAKAYFQEAEKLWDELVRDAPQYVQFQRFLAQVRRDLAGLE